MKASNLLAFLPTTSLFSTSKGILKFFLIHNNSHSGLQKNAFAFYPLAFMKTKLFIFFFFISVAAFGQFDLSLSVSGGLSKFNGQRFQNENIESNFRFSTGLDLLVQLNKNKHIQPFAGCSFYVLQSNLVYPQDWSYVEEDNHFRFNFLRIPIGIDVPVFEQFGIRLALSNSFLVGGIETSPEATKYEFGMQPGIYYSLNKWKVGFNYYRGFTDVFNQAEPSQNTYYWKVSNSAFYFTVGYKLVSF